ncbi:hypothetical protein BJ165DRAFT_417826 [Panaeolus papilionaceus]|nr:hypothetical protein BJ165DRAFT_417826 [Panaeolus papilionaceus]
MSMNPLTAFRTRSISLVGLGLPPLSCVFFIYSQRFNWSSGQNMLSLSHYILLSYIALSVVVPIVGSLPPSPDKVCTQIQNKLSSASGVYYPGDSKYEQGISHDSLASTQHSKCVVEPGNERDVAEVVSRCTDPLRRGAHESRLIS